jgi:hypothetical protein
MQFRMAPHQTKKEKDDSNTLDVLRTGEEKLLREVENLYNVFAVFTLAVRSFRSYAQSSHMEAKALSPSTSSA